MQRHIDSIKGMQQNTRNNNTKQQHSEVFATQAMAEKQHPKKAQQQQRCNGIAWRPTSSTNAFGSNDEIA